MIRQQPRLSRGSFELERLSQVATAHQRHHRLQIVARFTGDANLFALNLRLHLQLAVFDQLDDFFCVALSIPCFSFASTNQVFPLCTNSSGTSIELPSMPRFNSFARRISSSWLIWKSDSLRTLMVSFFRSVRSSLQRYENQNATPLHGSHSLRRFELPEDRLQRQYRKMASFPLLLFLCVA